MSRNSPVFNSSKAHDCPSTFGTLLKGSGDSPEANPHALGNLPQGKSFLVKPDYLLPVENLPWPVSRAGSLALCPACYILVDLYDLRPLPCGIVLEFAELQLGILLRRGDANVAGNHHFPPRLSESVGSWQTASLQRGCRDRPQAPGRWRGIAGRSVIGLEAWCVPKVCQGYAFSAFLPLLAY